MNSKTLVEAHERFFADPRAEEVKYRINDFSRANSGDLRVGDLDLAFAMDIGGSLYIKDLVVAFVVADPAMIISILHYVDQMERAGSTLRFAHFGRRADALEWIDQNLALPGP